MTNEELLAKAKALVGEERKVAAGVIDILRELDLRQMHLKMGYGSLQEFCVKELGYGTGAASRRVAAMKLIREMPETKELLVTGKLCLETMQAVQIHFKKKQPSVHERKELIEAVSGKSKREVERILDPEKRYTVVLTQREYELLQELKAAVGSSNLEKVLSESIKRISPARFVQPKESANSRFIPKSLKQAVFQRDQAKCTYPGCTETQYLQFDHRMPYSLGGQTNLENLRLRCSNHNRLDAYNVFGRAGPYPKRE